MVFGTELYSLDIVELKITMTDSCMFLPDFFLLTTINTVIINILI